MPRPRGRASCLGSQPTISVEPDKSALLPTGCHLSALPGSSYCRLAKQQARPSRNHEDERRASAPMDGDNEPRKSAARSRWRCTCSTTLDGSLRTNNNNNNYYYYYKKTLLLLVALTLICSCSSRSTGGSRPPNSPEELLIRPPIGPSPSSPPAAAPPAWFARPNNQEAPIPNPSPSPGHLTATSTPTTATSRITREVGEPPEVEAIDSEAGGESHQEPRVASQQPTRNSNELNGAAKLRIVRLLAPETVQNGTTNVTLDCMFKFDKKLDQRLTIKWFFNDEPEPIYQWIPELNKRVFADRWAARLDKSYQVSEDVEFMLQAYRWLADESGGPPPPPETPPSLAPAAAEDAGDGDEQDAEQVRRSLAGRLGRLARMGSRHSTRLIESLRVALELEPLEMTRYRALRLTQPTGELAGRYSCSVSSLEADDFRSKSLAIFEPPSSFGFTVDQVSSSTPRTYNLTCQADNVFPRPNLSLVRYRAGPLDGPSNNEPLRQFVSHRRLAASLALRQEPLAEARTHLSLPAPAAAAHLADLQAAPDTAVAMASNELISHETPRSGRDADPTTVTPPLPAGGFSIVSWALVEEGSLSSHLATQFECILTLEGARFEQRQSLYLQKGWHTNGGSASALANRSTLLGLFSVLASLLCLLLASVSSVLIFKLLRRHAKNRIHQTTTQPTNTNTNTNNRCNTRLAAPKHQPGSLSSTSTSSIGASTSSSPSLAKTQEPPNSRQVNEHLGRHNLAHHQTRLLAAHQRQQIPSQQQNHYKRMPMSHQDAAAAAMMDVELDDQVHLDDSQPVVKLKTSDGKKFALTRSQAYCSNALKSMIEATKQTNELIHLAAVDSKMLDLVLRWCDSHPADNAQQPTTTDPHASSSHGHPDAIYLRPAMGRPPQQPTNVSDWGREFLNSMPEETMMQLMHVANYLDVKSLFEACCKVMARRWEGKRVEDIRRIYNIQSDFSPEEEQQMITDNKRLGLGD